MSFACVLHFAMSSCALHCIRVCFLHPSIFPVVRFAIRHSYVLQRPPFASFRVRVLNFLGMARGLPSGLGIPPVDRLSSFVPFGGRLILQRLTEYSQRPLLGCNPTPLQNIPITHLSHFHALGRSITIVWAKTTPHLESPSSQNL